MNIFSGPLSWEVVVVVVVVPFVVVPFVVVPFVR